MGSNVYQILIKDVNNNKERVFMKANASVSAVLNFNSEIYSELLANNPSIAEDYKRDCMAARGLKVNGLNRNKPNSNFSWGHKFDDLPPTWADKMFAKYPITRNQNNGFTVTSPFISNTSWDFSSMDLAVEKVQQLIVWVYNERQRGYGNMDND